MKFLRRMRLRAGAILYDWPLFELRLRSRSRGSQPEPWLTIRNRDESIGTDSIGVECHWRFVTELHIANVFPATGRRLMRKALTRWPIAMREAPQAQRGGTPRVSFLIGHRGLERLPHLLATLRSIAGQKDADCECLVVEQSASREIEKLLPPWVRYIHTPLPQPDLAYCRAWSFNVAAKHARGDVLVLHDNDMLLPERYAAEALSRIDQGAAFVDLKRFLFYLDREETAAIFRTGAVPKAASSSVIQNLEGGSIVARRDAYEAIGGFDEQFIGWGGEDNEFFERALVFGGVNRFAYMPILHLYHEPQPGKASQATAAITRYRELQEIEAAERIARLKQREQGRMDGPAI